MFMLLYSIQLIQKKKFFLNCIPRLVSVFFKKKIFIFLIFNFRFYIQIGDWRVEGGVQSY